MSVCSLWCQLTPFMVSDAIDLSLLSFLIEESKGLSIFFILSKTWLCLLDLFLFLVSISFLSALIFKISFFLLTLGFLFFSFFYFL